MDPRQIPNNAPKRRRLHDDPLLEYHVDTGDHVGSAAPHQMCPVPLRQGFSATSQLDVGAAAGVNQRAFFYHNNQWNTSNSQSQPALMSLAQNSWYQPESNPSWRLSGPFVSGPCLLSPWPPNFPPPMAPEPPILQEPAQNYVPIGHPTVCHQFPVTSNPPPVNPVLWHNSLPNRNLPPPTQGDAMVVQDDVTAAPSSSGQITRAPGDGGVAKVCFGVVPRISARCDRKGSSYVLSSPFTVRLESSTCFIAENCPEVSGQIFSEHGQMIQGLLDEKSLDLYVSCTIDDSQSAPPPKAPRSQISVQCVLEITVYGPLSLFGEIGTWFDDYRVFLQDPKHCHLDVKYYNPHRLSADDIMSCPLVSEVVAQNSKTLHLESRAQQDDLLDVLGSHDDLEETPQPGVIKGDLRRQAFALMPFVSGILANLMRYLGTKNKLSHSCCAENRAGHFTMNSPMFGKWYTLSMSHCNYTTHMDIEETGNPVVSATLIVVPPPLSAEWSSGRGVGSSVLFSAPGPVLIKTAHVIRNGNSKMSQAACALESRSRWAVTGTPIQNRLSDLATLFKFTRAYPYTDRGCFEADISRLWKCGEYEEAVKRLKRLSACLLLRRPKGTINLPLRRDMQCPVDFSQEERALYNKLRQKAIVSIDDALKIDGDTSRAGIYVNVLQQIESLRLVCNLGLHYLTRHEKTSNASQKAQSWASVAQHAFNIQREMGPVVCAQCSCVLEITETLFDDTSFAQQRHQFFSCLIFVCAECAQRNIQANRIVGCGHNPRCAQAQVSTSVGDLECSLDEQPREETGHVNLPSKVEALITDMRTLPPHEKCIIFSTWRLTLDIIEAGLKQASLGSVRFDGKVPQKERQVVVDRFRTDPSIRVMLLTLSCGAAGLTLTVATRAYLMEPHWNPTLEEQALARIHRIGQTREVTTVRFYVRDSFEQQVMEVQESKKHLAGVLLSPHDGGQADESLGRLEMLRSLI
ncbi:alpha- -mannosyltransferase [Fusarium albosuccineum]|uniref:Alpha- -mannosyltransferase n=1 Tax=Fusarium albosuccineum TaxID=1237068 RepID=A0A8H4LBK6_9HYPO|nr:alpha- -mannosyltransferase [Fusarium albosuccineum]